MPRRAAAFLLLALLVAGCTTTGPPPGTSATGPATGTPPPSTPSPTARPVFPAFTAPSFALVEDMPAVPPCLAAAAPALAWGDADSDGDPDLALGCGVLVRNDAGVLAASVPLAPGPATALAWGDVDGDGCLDLAHGGTRGTTLLLNDCRGVLLAPVPALGAPNASLLAWIDLDVERDLDLFAGHASAPDQLWVNDGNGSLLASEGLPGSTGHATSAVWAQLNGDSYAELLVARRDAAGTLYRNQGDGTLRDVTRAARLPVAEGSTGADIGDYDGDGFMDILLAGPTGGVLLRAQGDGTFQEDDKGVVPAASRPLAAAFADLNGDGLPDILLSSPPRDAATGSVGSQPGAGGAILVNQGNGAFKDGTPAAWLAGPNWGGAQSFALADVDGDGDLDIAASSASPSTASGEAAAGMRGVRLLRNDGPAVPGGSTGASGGTWLQVRLEGNQSNALGLGARLAVREGDRVFVREARSGGHLNGAHDMRVHFGLGRVQGQIDNLEVLWPSGIQQVITDIDQNATITVRESPTSKTSCPLLFVVDPDGSVRFISDVTGNAYTGWLVAPPDVHHKPDPDELVRLDGLLPVNGAYELRLLEGLEEVDYVDHVQLVAVDHLPGVSPIPDEAFRLTEPYPGFGLAPLVAPRPIVRAVASGPGALPLDVTALVAERDRLYPSVPTMPPPRFDGYGRPHTLTLELGPEVASAARVRLAAWGWIYYPMVIPDLVVDGPYIAPEPPRMEALDPATGAWVSVQEDIGFPAGLPKWWTLDLTGKLPPGATQVRIHTNLRVYWDQFLVDTAPLPPGAIMAVQRIEPDAAELRFAGYPLFASPDGREPAVYHYDRMSPTYVWEPLKGNHTRFGDVTPLVQQRDDMFVVYGDGEELVLRFDASRLGAPAAGMERTMFAWFDLFTKDSEVHNAHPLSVDPYPFHAMTNYPFAPGETYPDDEAHRTYLREWQTRSRTS